jgi:DNA-binding beta-propeller fold protein YncE
MKIFVDHIRAIRLSRYWNALVSGAPAAELDRLGAGIAPEVLAGIELTRRGYDRQIPDPRFVARLEHAVMQAVPVPGATSASPSFVPPAMNGSVPELSRVGWPPYPARAGLPRAGAWVAAVLALLVVLGGIAVVSDDRTPETLPFRAAEDAGDDPAAIPAASSPAADPSLNGIAEPLWVSAATGPGWVRRPGFANVDPVGRVWVSSGGMNTMIIYDADGTYLEAWGGAGAGPGQFAFSSGENVDLGDVAFAADGGFYVADPGNRRVQRFDADRRFLFSWGDAGDGSGDGQLLRPASVAIAADGTILVSDFERNDVQRFAADGTYLGRFAAGPSPDDALKGAGAITIAPDGTVWVCGIYDARIHRFDAAGNLLGFVGGPGDGPGRFKEPWEAAFDADGNAHVADLLGGQIHIFAPDGAYLSEWGASGSQVGRLNQPGAIVIAGDTAYVSESGSFRLQAFRLFMPIVPMATPTLEGATPGS